MIGASSGEIGAHAGGRVGAAGVEDPADVIVKDALVGFGIQWIDLGPASKNCQLKKNKFFLDRKIMMKKFFFLLALNHTTNSLLYNLTS